MLEFNPDEHMDKDNYKLLIGSVIPRPIAFITSMSDEGVINGTPFSYFNIVSANPPLLSISIQRKSVAKKDTAQNILNKGQFVVHGVNEENIGKINQTAANLPAYESEIDKAGLTPINSVKIDVPGIKEAKIRYECMVEDVLPIEENGEMVADLIIGRVVYFHLANDVYDEGHIRHDVLAPVSRLAGSHYGKLNQTFSLERPE